MCVKRIDGREVCFMRGEWKELNVRVKNEQKSEMGRTSKGED